MRRNVTGRENGLPKGDGKKKNLWGWLVALPCKEVSKRSPRWDLITVLGGARVRMKIFMTAYEVIYHAKTRRQRIHIIRSSGLFSEKVFVSLLVHNMVSWRIGDLK